MPIPTKTYRVHCGLITLVLVAGLVSCQEKAAPTKSEPKTEGTVEASDDSAERAAKLEPEPQPVGSATKPEPAANGNATANDDVGTEPVEASDAQPVEAPPESRPEMGVTDEQMAAARAAAAAAGEAHLQTKSLIDRLCKKADGAIENCAEELTGYAVTFGPEMWPDVAGCMDKEDVVGSSAFKTCAKARIDQLYREICDKVTVLEPERCFKELPLYTQLTKGGLGGGMAYMRCLDAYESLGADQLDACGQSHGLPAVPWRGE